MSVLSLEQLIGSLMTHEMLVDSKEETSAGTKSIELKLEESDKENEVSLIAKRFEKYLRSQSKEKISSS